MSRAVLLRWAPAAVLVVGALFTVGIDHQQAVPLRHGLPDALPRAIGAWEGRDLTIPDAELQAAGVTDYLFRAFQLPGVEEAAIAPAFTLYVGYYDQQTQGRTIHSPKNCLPGSGWEALQSRPERIATAGGVVVVNRYLLQREDERALVLYWYQGRGRVESNEYMVKVDLLRDAALRGRTEEALVRIVVPVRSTEQEALAVATRAASEIVAGVSNALPG